MKRVRRLAALAVWSVALLASEGASAQAAPTMKLNGYAKPLLMAAIAPALLLGDFTSDAPLGWSPLRDAQAVIGAPMTPMSYAGVARRITARVVMNNLVYVVQQP